MGYHTLKKCLAFFDFRSGSRHARKFDAAGVLPCTPMEKYCAPCLAQGDNTRGSGCAIRSVFAALTLGLSF